MCLCWGIRIHTLVGQSTCTCSYLQQSGKTSGSQKPRLCAYQVALCTSFHSQRQRIRSRDERCIHTHDVAKFSRQSRGASRLESGHLECTFVSERRVFGIEVWMDPH